MMPLQLALPWIVMIPMIYGSSLVSIPLLLAFLIASFGLFAMHTFYLLNKPEESETAPKEETPAQPAEA